jgi:prevent-host-death family protein
MGETIMKQINITKLRSHLPTYLERAHKGTEFLVTSHGQVIARILPPLDSRIKAREALENLRKTCKIGDVISPIEDKWDVQK